MPSAAAAPPFVSLLADWRREHRAGRYGEATTILGRLVNYLDRMGSYR